MCGDCRHRDVRPDHDGPLELRQQADFARGRPLYVQWNVCKRDLRDPIARLNPADPHLAGTLIETLRGIQAWSLAATTTSG